MFIKSEAILIYEGLTADEKGSPLRIYQEKKVRCDEMETFSNQYYNDQQREMRLSRNIVVPTYLTDDIYDDNGSRYELMYLIYDGIKYKVRNILKYNGGRNRADKTRQRMVLDVQELR